MTVLLYDHQVLVERGSRHLTVWKVWHLILYVMAAIFGIANYTLMQSAKQMVDNHCILYPRNLSFHYVPRSKTNETTQPSVCDFKHQKNNFNVEVATNDTITEDSWKDTKTIEHPKVTENATVDTETTEKLQNTTIKAENCTHWRMLDTSRTLFGRDSDCEFAEYMPLMSTICAIVWLVLFTMCPGGGRPRSGLKRPWRIMTPALLSALVLVGLTGHSFVRTNGGLQDFCAAFANYTNSTTCSSVAPLLSRSEGTSWEWGARVGSVRAAAAGAWAAWACAAALLLTRCLTAPDFQVANTGVYLRDPQQKIIPLLRKSNRSSRRSGRSLATPHRERPERPEQPERSEPTTTTELADSAPTSLMATPIKKDPYGDLIEMTPRSGRYTSP